MTRQYLCRATDRNFQVLEEKTVSSKAAADRWKKDLLSDYPDAVATVQDVDGDGEPTHHNDPLSE